MNCPHCGQKMSGPPPPKGRPKRLDDAEVAALRARGLSLAEIAERTGVTRGAVQAALQRGSARAG